VVGVGILCSLFAHGLELGDNFSGSHGGKLGN
jgi:hypothetical protein